MDSPANPDDSDSTLRRPMNAFLLFCKRHRSIVKNGHPWLDNRSCTKMLADMWAVLDWDEKSKYLQLARECKMAFMKAHPDYKWCGSNKHNTKGSSPAMRTRTKSPSKHMQKPSIGVWASDNWSKLQTPSSSSSKISPGKLADPCDMGGLSLLLLAGEQTMNKATTTCHQVSETPISPKSKLFEFAEMCSDQLDLQCQSDRHKTGEPSVRHSTDHNANVTLHVGNKTSFKAEADSVTKPYKEVNQRCCLMVKRKTVDDERWSTDEDTHKERDSTDTCEEGQIANRNKFVKNRTEDKLAQPVIDKMKIEGIGSPSPPRHKELHGHKRESAVQCSADDDDEDMLDLHVPLGSGEVGWVEKHSSRRTSSRSCKGRLYREYVMEGMLESLQRPERPFNCKKSWKHLDGSSLSDGDDVVFEPNPDKPKRASRRNIRKRTVSGCGSLPNSADFDYGEIDVEARLASLPQYSPDQFKPKGKCHRQKKSTCLYKNSTFVKKDGKAAVRHMSRDQSTGASCSGQAQVHVAGSRKRKAPKSSILHLTLSQSQRSSQVSPGTSSNSRQFVVNNHQRSTDKEISSIQPSSTSPVSNEMCQLQITEKEESVNVSAVSAFANPLMTDSHQLPRTTSHVITAASSLHRSVLTVS